MNFLTLAWGFPRGKPHARSLKPVTLMLDNLRKKRYA